MQTRQFYDLVDKVIEKLRNISRENPDRITSCKSGDAFELCVVEVIKGLVDPDIIVHHTPGGHGFPDVIIEDIDNTKFGIEVKSSSSKAKGWKINGNSVMGSTRDQDVIETMIIFGKTSKQNLAFRAGNYESCVANVVVTHSPRYLIDMELSEESTFFYKSGITYKMLTESSNPIGLITEYFQKQGQQAWWLSNNSPASIRFLGDLSVMEKNELFGYSFAHFPELLSESTNKYKRLALWLMVGRSIASSSLRDNFSASGRVDLEVNARVYKGLPRIFEKLYKRREDVIMALNHADFDELLDSWDGQALLTDTAASKIQNWIKVCESQIVPKKLPVGTSAEELLNNIFSEYLK